MVTLTSPLSLNRLNLLLWDKRHEISDSKRHVNHLYRDHNRALPTHSMGRHVPRCGPLIGWPFAKFGVELGSEPMTFFTKPGELTSPPRHALGKISPHLQQVGPPECQWKGGKGEDGRQAFMTSATLPRGLGAWGGRWDVWGVEN